MNHIIITILDRRPSGSQDVTVQLATCSDGSFMRN